MSYIAVTDGKVGSIEINEALRSLQVADKIPYTGTHAAVTKGGVIVINDVVGVAEESIAENIAGELAIRGRFSVPKTSATPFSAGKRVFWDESEGVAVWSVSTGNVHMGVSVASVAAGVAYVTVALAGAAASGTGS